MICPLLSIWGYPTWIHFPVLALLYSIPFFPLGKCQPPITEAGMRKRNRIVVGDGVKNLCFLMTKLNCGYTVIMKYMSSLSMGLNSFVSFIQRLFSHRLILTSATLGNWSKIPVIHLTMSKLRGIIFQCGY